MILTTHKIRSPRTSWILAIFTELHKLKRFHSTHEQKDVREIEYAHLMQYLKGLHKYTLEQLYKLVDSCQNTLDTNRS